MLSRGPPTEQYVCTASHHLPIDDEFDTPAFENNAIFSCWYASIAACRARASAPLSACGSKLRSGNDDVHDDMLDARPGVRNGWGGSLQASDATACGREVDELMERKDVGYRQTHPTTLR